MKVVFYILYVKSPKILFFAQSPKIFIFVMDIVYFFCSIPKDLYFCYGHCLINLISYQINNQIQF